MTAHRQAAIPMPGSGVGETRLEIELFFFGILLSFIPLPIIIWAATGFKSALAFQVLKYRYEFAYAGLCALLLVFFQHYKSAHRYVICLSLLCVGFTFLVFGALLMYNNDPHFYLVREVIKDENVANYVAMASTLSLPLFIVSITLGIALILARKFSGVSRVRILEEDRGN